MFKHPVYSRYACDESGRLFNIYTTRTKTELKPISRSHSNYYTMSIFNGSATHKGQVTLYVHRFVWEAFNNKIIPAKHDIDHIDQDPRNNHPSNLQCMTRQAHVAKTSMAKTGKTTCATALGMPVKCTRSDGSTVVYESMIEAGRRQGVCASSIRRVYLKGGGVVKGNTYEPITVPDLTNEYWVCPIELKYRGCQVSNMGRFKNTRGLIVSQAGEGNYKQVTIRGHHTSLHAVVCSAFHGSAPTTQHTPDHINRDVTDNRPINLRWASPKEQSANRSSTKAVSAYHMDTGHLFKTYASASDAARDVGSLGGCHIIQCCRNTQRYHNGYIWRYTASNPTFADIAQIIASMQRRVLAFNKDGTFYKGFANVEEACAELSGKKNIANIRQCLCGKRKHALGYAWRHECLPVLSTLMQ